MVGETDRKDYVRLHYEDVLSGRMRAALESGDSVSYARIASELGYTPDSPDVDRCLFERGLAGLASSRDPGRVPFNDKVIKASSFNAEEYRKRKSEILEWFLRLRRDYPGIVKTVYDYTRRCEALPSKLSLYELEELQSIVQGKVSRGEYTKAGI